MPLHLNIEDLLSSRSVESDRIEFKEGWNPNSIYRSICAFANDIDNIGGGYIIIGVKEEMGTAKRPVKGLKTYEIAEIQKRMIGLNNLIRPVYHPKLFLEEVDGQQILVLWIPGGSNRPYEVPEEILANQKRYFYYIRRYANSVKADTDTQQELISLANQVPFDDRPNTQATLDDISMLLIADHLRLVQSKLLEWTEQKPKSEVLEQMLLIDGPPEHVFPKNVALMLFNEHPEKFFPATWVDVVYFPKGEADPEFQEYPKITGPIPAIIRRTLDLIKTNFIKEKILKDPEQAKAKRIFNYPFAALEEIIVNALFHRDYQVREQVEIRIYPNSIVVLNYGGPDRSIRLQDLESGRIRPRRYRNRRLGDFLKELDLTEGRATGIPTIKRALEINGSPPPSFRTDEDRSFFEVEIFAHQAFLNSSLVSDDQASDQASDQARQVLIDALLNIEENEQKVIRQVEKIGNEFIKILRFALKPVKKAEILEQGLHLSNHTTNVRRFISPLVRSGLLELTIKDIPNSPNQQYFTTTEGRKLLEILGKNDL